jgi:hypothetical protein
MLKMAFISHNSKAHQTWRSGQLLRLGFNEVAHFLSKSEVKDAINEFGLTY